MALHMKTGDTWPLLDGLITAGDVPTNLTGATVRFLMRKRDGTPILNNPAVIVDAVAGKVEYVWTALDTATAGLYYCEFRVTFGDGKVTTVPNDGYMELSIIDKIA